MTRWGSGVQIPACLPENPGVAVFKPQPICFSGKRAGTAGINGPAQPLLSGEPGSPFIEEGREPFLSVGAYGHGGNGLGFPLHLGFEGIGGAGEDQALGLPEGPGGAGGELLGQGQSAVGSTSVVGHDLIDEPPLQGLGRGQDRV